MEDNDSLRLAKETVSTMDIVEFFNVPHRMQGGRVQLICPNPEHNDSHFGSCYINKGGNGYHCYACNMSADKYLMVKQLGSFTDSETIKWFFNTSGVKPTCKKTKSLNNNDVRVLQLIKKLSTIIKNNPVYDDLYPCEKEESTFGRYNNGSYFTSVVDDSNPLLSLYKTNPSAFKGLVKGKIKEKQDVYVETILDCNKKDKDSYFFDEQGVMRKNEFYNELRHSCEEQFFELEELRKEIEKIK